MFEYMPSEHLQPKGKGLKEYCELNTLAMAFLNPGVLNLLASEG